MERMEMDVESRDFFKEPFTELELKKIIKMTGKKPSELLRKRDKTYKEMNLSENKKTDSEIVKLMVEYPGLILRPIIISKNNAMVGKIDLKNIKNYPLFSNLKSNSHLGDYKKMIKASEKKTEMYEKNAVERVNASILNHMLHDKKHDNKSN